MAVLRQKNGNDLAFDRLASKKYSNALQLTQRALQNSKSARSDEALATVLLLGIHELVIMDRPRCESSRISVHLIGAIKLLQLRGVEQMNYAWGRMMVLRTFTEIMTSCLYHRWPVPASIMDFQRSIRHTMHPEEMAVANLMEIAARLCNVLYRPVVDKTSEMLEALVAIDEDLDGWAQKSVTPRLSFERVPIENPDKSFLTYWDSYSNHISGLVWNTYRCMLILLNERLLSMSQDWAAGLEAKNQAYYAQRAPSRIAELCEGICRSVPFFLGEEGSTHAWLEESQEPPTMYGGMAMLIPLCVAADCKQVSPPVHSWLVHQISRLARDTRIAGAQAFLKRLRDESSQGVGP
ncbi:Hypothetical predicted protein [Lecanosticta acicola]|uniref:Uncharacterized protein n=1 Tax=Lecanosticta acicola TaxID=111012 RepID=A0AAI9E8F4_9PEZI|nr:Hypothetical predicted protein [Lecanosticta acicola]